MSADSIAFIGLGKMGQPLAGHLRGGGYAVAGFDIAGTKTRAPAGVTAAGSVEEAARRADVTFLSLPTVDSNRAVVTELSATARRGSIVVDTCTIGVAAAERNASALEAAGIGYVDAPVSGLRARAVEGTLASMVAGAPDHLHRVAPMLQCYSRTVYRVGERSGQGQRMKVVNNALCMAHYVIVSEALSYGEDGGLEMATMLDVINASSGQNFTTSVSFPDYVLTGRFDSGADAAVIEKDLALFIEGAREAGTPADTLGTAYGFIRAFRDADPQQDAMRIWPFIRGLSRGG